jgi:hypothetical protein
MVITGVWRQGMTGAVLRQSPQGVGLSHSSVETREGVSRAGGAKGRAGQGRRWRER